MAYTSTPTTRASIAIDDVARVRAKNLVPAVLAGYAPAARPAYVGTPPPLEVVDEAYVLTGAVRVGLNRWTLPGVTVPRPEAFLPRPGDDVAMLEVDVLDEDIQRAMGLSDMLLVPVESVLSAAACTGIAMMAGDAELRGPFEV